jgi:hypothetical protein
MRFDRNNIVTFAIAFIVGEGIAFCQREVLRVRAGGHCARTSFRRYRSNEMA